MGVVLRVVLPRERVLRPVRRFTEDMLVDYETMVNVPVCVLCGCDCAGISNAMDRLRFFSYEVQVVATCDV